MKDKMRFLPCDQLEIVSDRDVSWAICKFLSNVLKAKFLPNGSKWLEKKESSQWDEHEIRAWKIITDTLVKDNIAKIPIVSCVELLGRELADLFSPVFEVKTNSNVSEPSAMRWGYARTDDGIRKLLEYWQISSQGLPIFLEGEEAIVPKEFSDSKALNAGSVSTIKYVPFDFWLEIINLALKERFILEFNGVQLSGEYFTADVDKIIPGYLSKDWPSNRGCSNQSGASSFHCFGKQFPVKEFEEELEAAKYAWSCLEKIAKLHCANSCFHCYEREEKDTAGIKQLKMSQRQFGEQWELAQKKLHEAFSFLPKLFEIQEYCPACSVVKALQTFPQIAEHSSKPPIGDLIKVPFDVYDYVGPDGINQELGAKTVPCCRYYIQCDEFTYKTEDRIRENALLYMEANQIPPIHPQKAKEIKDAFLQGQVIVRTLNEMRKDIENDFHFLELEVKKEKNKPLVNEQNPVDKPETLPNRLPKLSKEAIAAYRIKTMGLASKQADIGKELEKEFGKPFSQSKVSKLLRKAEAHIKSYGVLPDLEEEEKASMQTMNPADLDLGARQDGRKHYSREE